MAQNDESKQKMIEPQFDNESIISGNYELADLPEPHVRRFPCNHRKRDVLVNISTWRGWVPGASHFYVRIEAEDNPIWDSAAGCWRVAWGDKGARDFSYDLRCDTKLKAWEFVKCIWDTYCDPKHHKLLMKYTREPIDLDQAIAACKGEFS